MATKYPFEINGADFSRMVERDSYSTTVTPVWSTAVVTMDGVEHKKLKRVRGGVSVVLNPQTAADTAAICNALLSGPVEVYYRCLNRHINVYATMVPNALTAQHLSRCRYMGMDWNDVGTITLTEL